MAEVWVDESFTPVRACALVNRHEPRSYKMNYSSRPIGQAHSGMSVRIEQSSFIDDGAFCVISVHWDECSRNGGASRARSSEIRRTTTYAHRLGACPDGYRYIDRHCAAIAYDFRTLQQARVFARLSFFSRL